jgi:hypothetical protein
MIKYIQIAFRVISIIPLCLYTFAAIIDWQPTAMQKSAGVMWTFVGLFLGWLMPFLISDK